MRVLVGLVSAALLLAGCSGSGGAASPSDSPSVPASSPSSSATSSAPAPSPSRTGPLTTGPGVRPGEKPPVLDPEAKKRTPTGALLFGGYYFHAMDWSFATTDPYLLQAISDKSCVACQRAIDKIRDLRARGGHLTGGRISVLRASLVDGEGEIPADHIVELKVRQERTVVVIPGASPRVDQASSEVFTSYLYISWRGGSWKIEGDYAP